MRTAARQDATADPRANRLLAGLEPSAYRALEPHLHVAELRRETILLKAGEEAGHVWFPHDGAVLALGAVPRTLARRKPLGIRRPWRSFPVPLALGGEHGVEGSSAGGRDHR